jgi:Uma2 family endonuclease
MAEHETRSVPEVGTVIADGIVYITTAYELPQLDVSHLVTEDDTPVDNLPSEKNQRLLVEPLYSSWRGGGEERPFLAAANVGVFSSIRRPPIVPDALLSLDVSVADAWWEKEHRSYFVWEFGKAPDVVIEIVSNTEGREKGKKLEDYAKIGVPYYVVYDPMRQLKGDVLEVYGLKADGGYERREDARLPRVGLGLTLWEGLFEGKHDTWLRWCDEQGEVIPTGAERAGAAEQRADEAELRADEAELRAEIERKARARLAERLRELGVDPDGV